MPEAANEQLDRFLAEKVMGLSLAKNDDGKDWYYRPDVQEWECSVGDWNPTSDLDQAFQVLSNAGCYQITSFCVDAARRGDSYLSERRYHDNTPTSIALAICAAVAKAYGWEAANGNG